MLTMSHITFIVFFFFLSLNGTIENEGNRQCSGGWGSGGRGHLPRELETQPLMGERPEMRAEAVGAQGQGRAGLCEGELGLAGDTYEGERGAASHDRGGLGLSWGIWTESQGDMKPKDFYAGGG